MKPNHCSASTWNNLLSPRWELDPAGAIIRVVADDNSSLAGCPGEDTSITNVIFNVTDLGTFGSRAQGQNVIGNEGGFLTAANELARVYALSHHDRFIMTATPTKPYPCLSINNQLGTACITNTTIEVQAITSSVARQSSRKLVIKDMVNFITT